MHRPAHADGARGEAAAVAARALAEGDAGDFDDARERALDLLNIDDRHLAPTNADIHRALTEHLALFHRPRQQALLERLRRAALEAMEVFAAFSPQLTGPVWDGTALPDSAVSLHLGSDEPEAVIRMLLERGISYHEGEARLRFPGQAKPVSVPRFDVVRDDILFELTVFPTGGRLRAPLSPVDQRPVERAGPERLQRLLDSGELFPASAAGA